MNPDAEDQLKGKIVRALKLAKEKLDSQKEKANFIRILIRFPKIKVPFEEIRALHKKYDVNGDGRMDVNEFMNAYNDMVEAQGEKAQGAKLLPAHKIQEAFSLCMIDQLERSDKEKELTQKEFIVACTIGFILSEFDDEAATVGGMLASKDDAFHSAMMDVVTAYLSFDLDCKGYFTREDFDGFMSGSKRADAAKGVITDDRWKELDVSGDGRVDFEEFVFAFSHWVSEDDDEEDE
eukprot:CAMPEP_0197446964 /NCGR_PEP_ID=MMETSP1175-20131217/11746_1 /TAXON_ID=1003142 /ORGANISM="Triceratium dubium, Strain CCMP147" /LENGTH=235 /DNA_ID=CAMNT_0042978141 /DNA_START=105 /DNA_END=812 /DNA_ORIENTATION=+